MGRTPCVLTVAGSDSGGGAGIQADLKTISMLGCYGASVLTALTAQNTAAVTDIHAPPPVFVAEQLRTVLSDISVDAVKTGMLFSEGIISEIAPLLSRADIPLVVDPVCVATSGAKLLEDDAVDAMVRKIFPLADILTPNIPEAELFTGLTINDRDDVFKVAEVLLKMGPRSVLIKGGHSKSWAITDWFVESGKEPIPFIQQRVDTPNTHGTGCTLSAAIATGLAQGESRAAAIQRAQRYLHLALRAAYRLGEGGGPPNHIAPWIKETARSTVLKEVEQIARWIQETQLERLLGAEKSNIAASIPYADALSDVASFSGGLISSHTGQVFIAGAPEFGVEQAISKALLAVRRFNDQLSCGVSVSGNTPLKRVLHDLDTEVMWIERKLKPDYLSNDHGACVEWGAYEGLKKHASPDEVRIIVDPGDMGCESRVYILEKDSARLQRLLLKLADLVSKQQ